MAQRKKPRSLEADLDTLDSGLKVKTTSESLDEFESLLITNQVVHSFPNDKHSANAAAKSRTAAADVEECITNYKLQIPEVIPDEPVVETAPIFRPKQRITLRKKKTRDNEDSNSATGLLTSTPTKHDSQKINHSLDLFSDSSLVLDEEAVSTEPPALCDDYGRHVVIDCSVG